MCEFHKFLISKILTAFEEIRVNKSDSFVTFVYSDLIYTKVTLLTIKIVLIHCKEHFFYFYLSFDNFFIYHFIISQLTL